MKRLVLAILLFFPVLLQAQTYPVNSNGGNISSTNASCVPTACIGITVSNIGSISVTVTGTFSATLAVESSTDGSTFSSAGTSIISAGSSSYSATGLVLFRVRASAYTSGNPGVNITTSSQGGGGTVTAVTGSAPIVSSGGTTPDISCPTCLTSSSGVTSVTASAPIASSGGATPNLSLTGIVPVANGGTGTATPSLVSGTNVNISGSFPNQTINVTPFTVVQSGLMAEYRMLPSETCAALVDYSGNGRNATGTVGTAPTIIANTGGCNFTGAGAVSLPSALNSALTIQVFAAFQPSATSTYGGTPPLSLAQALVQGNDAAKHAIAMELFSRQNGNLVATTVFAPISGGFRPVSEANDSATANLTWTTANFVGAGSLTLAMDTLDQWYYNGVAIQNNNAMTHPVAGQQTAGNYQLGGAAAGAGQTAISYYIGQIYYVLFYNRVLTAAEVLANHNLVAQAMAARGVNVNSNVVTTDQVSQIVAMGDSITVGQGVSSGPSWPEFMGLPITPLTNQLGGIANENQGIQLATANGRYPFAQFDVDTFYRPGAMANAMTYWLGTNDGGNAPTDWGLSRDYMALRRAKGFKVFPITMLSRTAADANKNALNPLVRSTWFQYSDGFPDVAANPNLGADNAFSNTLYFSVDGIHPNTTANQFIIAPIVNAALARVYGPSDFSSARTVTATSTPAFVNAGAFNVSGFSQGVVTVGTVTGNLSLAVFVQAQTPDWITVTVGGVPISVTSTSNGGSVWYYRNLPSGQLKIKVFRAAGLSTSIARGVWGLYSGVSSYSPIESFANNNAGSGTTMTGGAVNPAQANSMVIGIGGTNSSASSVAGSGGYTLRANDTHSWLVDQVLGTGSTTPTATNSTSLTNYGMTSIVLAPEATGLVQLGDADDYVKVDPSGASVTAMLPTAVGMTGQRVNVKNVQTSGANTVTVVPKAFRILSVTGNGTTVTYTVDNTYSLIAGQTVTTSGCTTGGFNLTATVASVPSTTTFTVTNATNATENEPVAARYTNETIDGATSATIANDATAIFQSVLVGSTTGGANWIRVQ